METKVKKSEEYVQVAHDINVKNQRNQYFYGVVSYLWTTPVLLLVYFIGIYYLSDKKIYIDFAHGVVTGSMLTWICIMFLKKVVIEQKKFTVDKDENLIQAKALKQWDLKKSDNEKKALIKKLEQEERDLKAKAGSVGNHLCQLKDDVSS